MEDYSGLMAAKLAMLRSLVAQPVTTEDPQPCVVGDSILVGNKFHVTQPALLSRLGVTAVLNCAPSGIRNLPLDDYEEWGIKYHFTNCARDDENYPILHNRDGLKSTHLEKAQEVYAEVKASGGKVLFNCAAGQNRSATLAVAVQVCSGVPLQRVLEVCAETRPFVVENVGFQRQLVELEAMMTRGSSSPSAEPKRAEPGGSSVASPSDPLQWLSSMMPAEVAVELTLTRSLSLALSLALSLSLSLSLSLRLTLTLILALILTLALTLALTLTLTLALLTLTLALALALAHTLAPTLTLALLR